MGGVRSRLFGPGQRDSDGASRATRSWRRRGSGLGFRRWGRCGRRGASRGRGREMGGLGTRRKWKLAVRYRAQQESDGAAEQRKEMARRLGQDSCWCFDVAVVGFGRTGSEAFGEGNAGALAIAGAVDVDANRLHGKPVEDSGSDGSVAEVAAPIAELDVRGNGGTSVAVTLVDEVVEGMGSSGLIGTFADLSDPDVINDKELGFGPSLEPLGIGLIGKARV